MDGFTGQVWHFPGTMIVSRSKLSVNGTNGMKKIEQEQRENTEIHSVA